MPERHKGKVRGRVYDRRPDAKPKRPVLPGLYPDTKAGWKAAERAEGAWYEANRPDAQVTVDQLREQYLADHASRWDVLSTTRARELTRRFSELYGTEPAEQIKPETCRRYLAKRKGDRQSLRAMWAWAIKADMLQVNPWDKLGATGSSKSREQDIIVPGRGALTEPELLAFAIYAEAVHGEWLGRLVRFTGYTGLRQGELFAARPDWVKLGGLLEVSQQFRSRAPAGEQWTLPKYGKTRTLALLPEAAAELDSSGAYLWGNPSGGHWTAGAMAYYWNTTAAGWSASADAPGWLRSRHQMVKANRKPGRTATGALTMHELRHTFATMLLEDGVIHDKVALQLGDTVEQVYKTYGHPRSVEAAETVHRIRAEAKARRMGTVTDLEERRRARG